MSSSIGYVAIASAIAVIACTATVWLLHNGSYLKGYRFPSKHESIVREFAGLSSPQRSDYEALAAYFQKGFVTYLMPGRSSARYPGLASGAGQSEQDLEGFSRIAPLLAVVTRQRSAQSIEAMNLLSAALTAGSDPESPGYWGAIRNRDQRIAEAADVALAVWLSRDTVWKQLPPEVRARTVKWLVGVNGKVIVDNNWHLFIAQVNVALQALGETYDETEIVTRISRVREFYAGEGWFRDGPNGPFDYYNAWGFWYHLGWIHRMNPGLVDDLVRIELPKFSAQLIHLMTPDGFPIFGRSVCYRLAVTAPLLLSAEQGQPQPSGAQSRRALDVTWQYFAQRNAIRQGRITQGYCEDNASILDDYSGPASCLWSLRSLILALDMDPRSEFWSRPAAALPIENGDFRITLGPTALQAIGDKASGEVVILNPAPLPDSLTRIHPYSFKARVADVLRGGSRRPANEEAKYGRAAYSSAKPFCGCSGEVRK